MEIELGSIAAVKTSREPGSTRRRAGDFPNAWMIVVGCEGYCLVVLLMWVGFWRREFRGLATFPEQAVHKIKVLLIEEFIGPCHAKQSS